MHRNALTALAALALLSAAPAVAHPLADAAPPPRRNVFGDPFVQLSSAWPGCPQPAGPFMTAREQREASHRRAEKGTTCWLAGQCRQHSDFLEDPGIAAALREAAAARPALLAHTTLWATVQGRVVYLEGCAADAALAPALEAWAMALPQVQRALALLRTPADGARTPYKRLDDPD